MVVAGAILLCWLALSSCMSVARSHLTLESAKPSDVSGTYTLLLYGCRYPDDLENVAILVKEGGPPFDIYALDTRYRIQPGLSSEEALKEAGQFVKCGVHYQQTRFSAIKDPEGTVVGYEVRPLYSPIRFGQYDVLDIQYVSDEGAIVVYVKLDPTIEMEQRDGGERDRDGK